MLEWLEFEELVGRRWHQLVGDKSSYPRHPEAAVELGQVRNTLAVVFRALGGDKGLGLSAASSHHSRHRLTLRQRIGMEEERIWSARRDETTLALPPVIDLFPEADLNRRLYTWLAGYFACLPASPEDTDPDPLRRDLRYLVCAARTQAAVLARFPGLHGDFKLLSKALLKVRPARKLKGAEAEVEAAIRALLGGGAAEAGSMAKAIADEAEISRHSAPRGYRPFLPVPMWGDSVFRGLSGAPEDASEDDEPDGSPSDEQDDDRRRKASRENDQGEREDGLILNNMEKILALAEMVRINRAEDDEEEENARKAADDMDELAISRQKGKKKATKLRLDLDLAPEGALGGELIGRYTYPEWDCRKVAYLPNHCKVEARTAQETSDDIWVPSDETRAVIRRVRRQFEALRPTPILMRGQPDGDDLDLEALVRSRADFAAGSTGSDRVFQKFERKIRDLSVAFLVDVSLSTDAWIEGRRVLDVEKEALSVLAAGLDACGDEHAILTFTSRRRNWVRLETVKDFEEPLSRTVQARIAALKPGYYTRMGAAVRHAADRLQDRPHRHKLLLVLTDGKPNDVDHYEGRFGLEDTRIAIQEARRMGLNVFGVTVDTKGQDYFPHLFGRGSFAIVSNLARLAVALPRIYRQLTV